MRHDRYPRRSASRPPTLIVQYRGVLMAKKLEDEKARRSSVLVVGHLRGVDDTPSIGKETIEQWPGSGGR